MPELTNRQKEFENFAAVIMEMTTKENCVEMVKRMYRLKKEYFEDLLMKHFGGRTCPLCKVYGRQHEEDERRCNICPLGPVGCCDEYGGFVDALDWAESELQEDDEPPLYPTPQAAFAALHDRIMAIPDKESDA